MSQILDFSPNSLLDIGCNIGSFCFRFCSQFDGLAALGIDADRDVIAAANAIARLFRIDRVEFSTREFGTDEDRDLPQSDVVCCLSLLHHIFGLQGREAGLNVVKKLRGLTLKTLFFEIGCPEETDSPWAKGLKVSLPGGEQELCDLLEESGFSRPIVAGESSSHLAPVIRRLWVARV